MIQLLKKVIPKNFVKYFKLHIRRYLVSILSDPKVEKKVNWYNHPQVTIGRYTYGIVPETIPLMESKNWRIDIGSFCSIAPSVKFVLGLHEMNTPTTFPIREFVRKSWNPDSWLSEQIEVGNDVWIASNALILSGSKIGHGAIIAAGAVVKGVVPPYAIVAGVPAKLVRMRMKDDQINAMLKIAWWNWPEEKILANEPNFYGDVNNFICLHS